MKRCASMFAVLALLVLISGCTRVYPDAGTEAVLVMKPWIIGKGGIDSTPVKPGSVWVAWSTQAVYINIQPRLFIIHFDDFMSSDGVPLDFDVALRLRITDSVKMVDKFGVNTVQLNINNKMYEYPVWYVNNVHKNLENAVRQAVRKHGMNETAISTVAIDQIDKEITGVLKEYITSIGLPVELVDFTVGRANPPDAVKHQRIETAMQEQRINTEKQRRLAEDQRKSAETARAAADNAYRNDMQLSPEQFLRLEQIKIQDKACTQEKSHCTFVVGGGNVVPTVNVGK